MLEIGIIHRPRREQADAGIVLAIQSRQRGLEGLEKGCQALDPDGAIDFRDGALQSEPALEHEARARGRLGAVAQHPPAAVGAASDIDRIEPQMRAARRRHTDQRPQKFGIAGDQHGGQQAVAHDRARPIGVLEHQLEQLRALDEPALELGPFGRIDDERQMAERPRPLGAGRIPVDAVEHAGIVQVAVRNSEASIDLIAAERLQHRQERPPMGTDLAVPIDHLIEDAGKRPVARQQALQALAVQAVAVRLDLGVGTGWH